MFAVLNNVVLPVLAGVWVVGTIIFLLRYQRYRTAYLKRLPPFKGVPLYMYGGFGPRGVVLRAMGDRQSDPELERMRRDIWRAYDHGVLWILGFPVLGVGIAALVLIFFPH